MQKSEIVNREKVYNKLFTSDDKIFVSKSPFSAFESTENEELVFRGRTSPIRMEHIMMQVKMGYVKIDGDDGIDLEILKALNELEFATSRMITIYINLKGINITQDKVQKRLHYLNKIKILSSYEFRSKDEEGRERKSQIPIYFLDIAGTIILKSQDISCYWNIEDTIKSKHGIKEILSRNQLMLTYLIKIKNIEYTKNRPMYKLIDGEDLFPDLQIVFEYKDSTQYMFFEFIRTFNGWENKIINKLNQYKLFYENFKPSNSIRSKPILIFVSEDDAHAFNIMKTIITNDLTISNQGYLFTTDTRIISDEINKSIFKFTVENNKASITILNIELFHL